MPPAEPPPAPGPLRILIVDDSEDDALLMARQFRAAGHAVAARRVDNAATMVAALMDQGWDLVIADVTMPHFSAAEALALYAAHGEGSPFLVVSGTIGEETAVALMKSGADDFVHKGNLVRLLPAAERAWRECASRRARRAAEEALRASEERYALAARGANDGLWDWNLRTNRIYLSARWVEMLGEPAPAGDDQHETRPPEDWLDRVHPDDLPLLRQCLDAHLAGQSPQFSVEYRIRHADGGWRWVLARGQAVFDGRGEPCRLAGSQTDISPHKQAEIDLRRAKERLEDAVAAKTRFLAAASHDLRQPVQALLCFAALLQPHLATPAAQRVFADLHSSVENLKALLDALLDVSRLDAGVVKPLPEVFVLGDLLTRLAGEMRPLAEAKGLRLDVVGSRLAVRSDPVLFGRILRNLVDNAIRYTPSGRILLGCRRRGGQVVVEVRDTGIGIGEAAQERIFEEFYQVANTERDRRKGLGLGLAIVARLVRLLDLDLSLRSVPGRGACFAIGLPVIAGPPAEAASAALPVLPAAETAGSHTTVLVIDDEAMVANALAALLRAWGFHVVAAGSLEDAVRAIAEPPAAIVADYRLREGKTGLEAVDSLRSRFARHIPSIVVTGDIAADRLRDILGSGALLLHKPVTPQALQNALQTVLAGQPVG